jgi:hypothetical protein
VIAGALVAAALATGPVALMDAPRGEDVAFAGNEIVLTRLGERGNVIVNAVAVEGGAVRRLLKVRHPPGREWTAQTAVEASPERVAVAIFYEQFREHSPSRYLYRLYSGSPAGPLRLVINRPGTGWVPASVDVDGDRLLLTEAHLEALRLRMRLFAPGAPPRVLRYGEFASAELAGDHLALTTFENRLIVRNLVTGAREVDVFARTDAFDFDVAPDGRVVADPEEGLFTVAPGQPLRRLGSGVLDSPRFAGTHIAAVELTGVDASRPVIFDPGATSPRALGVPTDDAVALDADERGVAWLGNGCVLYAPVGSAAPVEPPAGPCPRMEASFEEHDQVLRGRTLRVEVNCVAAPVATGCTGTVVMRRHGFAGSGRYRVPAGTEGVATVTLTRRAARLVRRQIRRQGDSWLRLRGRLDDGRPPAPRKLFIIVSAR